MDPRQGPLEEVKTIANRIFFSGPLKRVSVHEDAMGLFVLLTLYQETGEQKYLERIHQLVHESTLAQAQSDVRFTWFNEWNYALWKAGQVTKDPVFESSAITAIRKVHPKFVQAAGTEHPRIWGALDVNLENETDLTQANLAGEIGLVCYSSINSTNEDPAILKIEAEQMERVVKSSYIDFYTNDAEELGEALWLTTCVSSAFWVNTLREHVFSSLDSMYDQGYFTAAKNFRKAAPELWTAFGISCCKGVPAVWTQRAADIRATWRQDALDGSLSLTGQLAYCLAVFPGAAWRGHRADPTKELMELSVRQLRLACKAKGVDFSGCIEKQDLIKLLLSKTSE